MYFRIGDWLGEEMKHKRSSGSTWQSSYGGGRHCDSFLHSNFWETKSSRKSFGPALRKPSEQTCELLAWMRLSTISGSGIIIAQWQAARVTLMVPTGDIHVLFFPTTDGDCYQGPWIMLCRYSNVRTRRHSCLYPFFLIFADIAGPVRWRHQRPLFDDSSGCSTSTKQRQPLQEDDSWRWRERRACVFQY